MREGPARRRKQQNCGSILGSILGCFMKTGRCSREELKLLLFGSLLCLTPDNDDCDAKRHKDQANHSDRRLGIEHRASLLPSLSRIYAIFVFSTSTSSCTARALLTSMPISPGSSGIS